MLRLLCPSRHFSNRLCGCNRHQLMRNSKPDASLGTKASKLTAASHNNSSTSPAQQPKIIIITGPTAVGKTRLGLELAKHIGGEIISADSVQVYKGLDIGSDKLPVEQQEGVPHHLIDILPPDAEFSAGDFYLRGRQAAADIIARGKVPIVVGGTGFYLRWFMYGRASTPPSTPQTALQAQQLIEQAWLQAAAASPPAAAAAAEKEEQPEKKEQENKQGLQQSTQPQQHPEQQLQQADTSQLAKPSSSMNTQQQQHTQSVSNQQQGQQQREQQVQLAPPAPPVFTGLHSAPSAAAAAAAACLSEDQRWVVAVDVVRQLGDQETAQRILGERNNWYRLQRVLQILLQNGGRPLRDMNVDTSKPLEYDFRCFFLHRPRLDLFDRILYRVEEMVVGGLLSEALLLLDLGMTANSHIATKAIGYRQACAFMQAALDAGGATKEQLQQLITDIATSSRNLVKNQTTWFRDDSSFRWLEVGGRSTEEVLQDLLAELEKPEHEGGCGDSGRLGKEDKQALKRYVPTLKLFGAGPDGEAMMAQVLEWVQSVVENKRHNRSQQQRQQQQQQLQVQEQQQKLEQLRG